MNCIALLSLDSESPTKLEDYTALRLGQLLSSCPSLVCVAVSRKDFYLTEDQVFVTRGLRFVRGTFEEQSFEFSLIPVYVFFIHHCHKREYRLCLDLLVQVAERGIPTNYDPDASDLGVKSVLEERCHEYEMASGRAIPRPRTIIVRGDQDKQLITELMRSVGPCILKPHNSSRSRGVKVIATAQQVKELDLGKEIYVAQELIPHPFLIDGYKTGLRVYLMIYDLKRSYLLSEQGLVKMPAKPYVRADAQAEIVGPHMKRDGEWPAIYLLKDLVNSADKTTEWKTIRRKIDYTVDRLMEAVSWRAGMFHRRSPTLQVWGVDLLVQKSGQELEVFLIEVNTFPALYREDDFTDSVMDEFFVRDLFSKALNESCNAQIDSRM